VKYSRREEMEYQVLGQGGKKLDQPYNVAFMVELQYIWGNVAVVNKQIMMVHAYTFIIFLLVQKHKNKITNITSKLYLS
jgi:hypothetical protein